jgi:hypothetical protein
MYQLDREERMLYRIRDQEWLTPATKSAFIGAGVISVEDLWAMSDEEILAIKGVGEGTLNVARLMQHQINSPEATEEEPEESEPVEVEQEEIELDPEDRKRWRATMAFAFIMAHINVAQHPRNSIVSEAFIWADQFIDISEGTPPEQPDE